MREAVLAHGLPRVASGVNRGDGLSQRLITLGAVLRVAAPLELIDYTSGMRVSALAWGAAFAIFLGTYGPILFRPRLGEA